MNAAPSGPSLVLPSLPMERTRANPPGQPQLIYSGGAFLNTLDRLLMRLQLQTVPSLDGSVDRVPFARFNEESSDDWTRALLHAWAAVTDVLGFYHERIVNEGYLRTATERLSLVQLARTVGYELQPGLAASALLAITVVQGSSEPPRSVFVPKGTAVQSVPLPKSGLHLGTPAASLPQIFETSEDLLARSEWNLLRAAARGGSSLETLLAPDTTSVRLLGARTDLKKGDRLLIVNHDPDDPQRVVWRVVQIATTTPDVAKGVTAVSWEAMPGLPAEPLSDVFPPSSAGVETSESPGQPGQVAGPQLFVMRQRAKLFAYTSTGMVRTWPATDAAASPEAGSLWAEPQASVGAEPPGGQTNGLHPWWPAGIGLPHEPITVTLATHEGPLFAATAKDLYRSVDGGATWQRTGAGLQGRQVTALTGSDDGTVIAGTDKGEVFLSPDAGETWRQAASDPIYLPARGLRKLTPAILRSAGHLPVVVVSALAAYRDGSKDLLAAGTDSGVFLSSDRGGTWKTANLVLPKLDRKTGLTKVGVSALAVVQTGKRRRLYAGTDAGVFPIRATPNATPVLLAGVVLALLYRLLFNAGGVLTKQVYALAVGLVHSAAGAVAALLRVLQAAMAKIDLPLAGNPIATPADKLIENVGRAILTPIAQLPATLPVPTAAPVPSPTATATTTPIAALTTTVTPPAGTNPALKILATLDQHSFLWLFVDAALIAAAIGALIVAWWLLWRFLNNRPSRRIAATLPIAPDGLASAQALVKPRPPKNPPVAVRDLRSTTIGIVAGTTQGIYHAVTPGPHATDKWPQRLFSRLGQLAFPGLLPGWTRIGTTATQPDIQTLAVSTPQTMLAATKTGDLYRYRFAGGSWQPAPQAPGPLPGVSGIAASADGLFLAGTPPKAKVGPQWSPWQVDDRAIHLDSVYDSIAAGSWLVLLPAAGEAGDGQQALDEAPQPHLYKVLQAARADSDDAVRRGQFTSITVDRDRGLALCDRIATQALFQSEPLEIYAEQPVQGNTVALDSSVPGLQPGQVVIVSGKRMRVRLVAPPDTTATLTAMSGLQRATVHPGESLVLLGLPPRPAAGGQRAASATSSASSTAIQPAEEQSTEIWRLLNRDGIDGQVAITRGSRQTLPRFAIEPPEDRDPEVSELAVIRSIIDDGHHTTLVLTTDPSGRDDRPLANIFERTTVGVRANVVHATHGSTVPAEVVGSSDGTQANQRFVLRQAPLTVVSRSTPEGLESTLSITVAGAAWHQVPSLYGRSRDERAYTVQHDEKGHATITFGDGRAGARLPSTREEIRATYRIGIGEVGNVAAGSLTQLRSAPPGLAGVTNPLPASGGVDPEADDSIRANATLGLAAMHRIVSLSDYEDFVQAFPGIGRVQARFLHTSQGGLLHLTVADSDGNPLDPTSSLSRSLADAVERARVAPTPRLRIDSYEAVVFDVTTTLVLGRDDRARQPIVQEHARQALAEAFTFRRRRFAQDVTIAEIITVLQPITGVVGVEVKRLACHDIPSKGVPPPISRETLLAQPARWQEGRVRPAQMLLINRHSPNGIVVDVEVAQ